VKQPPLVSVIVPTYNASQYIVETIESIFNQNYSPIEVIIVDDGSTDDTKILLKPLIATNQIIYYRIENSGGPSTPRNVGINKANGECIFIFDADDIMMPNKIKETVNAYTETKNMNVGLYFTDFIRINKQSEKISDSFLAKYKTFHRLISNTEYEYGRVYNAQIIHKAIIQDNFIGTSSVMLTKDVKDAGIRFDEEMKNADDLDMWLKISRSYNLMYVDMEGHGYRIHNDGVFSRSSSNKYMNRALAIERQLNYTKDKETILIIKNKIAKNYYSAGYFHQEKKEFRVARQFYWKGLLKTLNSDNKWLLIRGIIITYIKSMGRKTGLT